MRSDLFSKTGSLLEYSTGAEIEGGDLRRAVAVRARELRAQGISEGKRILLTQGNTIPFFIDLLALWELRACAVPVDPSSPATELRAIAAHCETAEAPESGEALILYTSGTSGGTPKAVVHSFDSVAARLDALAEAIPVGDLGVSACLLPTHFGHGLLGNSLFPLLNGQRLVLLPAFSFDSVTVLNEVVDLRSVTFFSTVPAVWEILSRFSVPAPLSRTLRRVHCASAPFSPESHRFARQWSGRAQVTNVYGLTEVGSWTAGTVDDAIPEEGLVGKPWGAEVRAGTLEAPSEVLLKTKAIMCKYLGNPSLTAQALDSEGWFHTGDVGYVDVSGQLRLLGRSGDVINQAGMKIYPEEIEAVIRSLDGVRDVCVFAVPHDVAGETVAAAVVFEPGYAEHSLDALDARCRERLRRSKVPSRWFALEEIPRSVRGKVIRDEIRRLCLPR